LVRETPPEKILQPETWVKWSKKLDSSLLGGTESTFVSVAVVGNKLIGVSVGDSRAYLVGAAGGVKILSASTQKARLGSGHIQPFTFSAELRPKDIVLLMSDGAWTPLTPYLLERAIRGMLLQHFSEVPDAVLNASSRTGRWDDMTVVALRLVGQPKIGARE
jgi:serine/threonine protein phosphatase PrpC